MSDVEFKLEGNCTELEEETQEQLEAVHKKLSDLSRGNGQLVTMTKQELSLLQKILTPGTEDDDFINAWRSVSFKDEDEAFDHVAAYQEAKDLGMDTKFNIRYMYSLCSANRKGNFVNNLLSLLSDTLQNGKWANAENSRKRQNASYNPRSPLSGT